ncbi:hypothetical protein [Shewanella sp. 10N.286.48.B5]|uniref:hypothetical protein n=1 Tax=Shewanella sp. 10N.286.48.B5 TaxID=1880834 RepID=UPI000C854CA4|nr:hypothetical protein BCU57_18885 [Shewanella sp. 10N.286.48.B5]
MGLNAFLYLFVLMFVLAYINFNLLIDARFRRNTKSMGRFSGVSFLFLACLSLFFVYLSGEINSFLYYSPGSDSDLFIEFLKIISSGQTSYHYEIFSEDNKNGFLNIISPIFIVIEPGSLLAISLMLLLNLLFVAMIAKRIVSLSNSNDRVAVQCLIVLCPLTAMLMVSYLRDIFAIFLVVEIVFLIHVWRTSLFNTLLILLLSLLLYYTRSFYLFAILTGLLFNSFKFKFAMFWSLLSLLLVIVFIDLKPILIRILVLHGDDAARLGGNSLSVEIDDIDTISPITILKRIILGFFTMIVTPQPAFILKDILGAKGSGFQVIENSFQLVYSFVYIVFILPITVTLLTSISKLKLLLFKKSKFHFILFFVLFSVFFIYAIKFFGIRHYKVEYVKYILWLGVISFFPIVSHVKTKKFICFSMLSSLFALLITVKYLY